MTEHANEVRVGITLSIAVVILVVGILWLGGFTFGDDRYSFNVIFTEVAGLSEGDKVTVAGIDAGEVLSLQLAPLGRVVAQVEVDDYIMIPDDSRFSVASYGLIGAKVIAVKPGSSDRHIKSGDVVRGVYEKGLGDVVSEMGEALTEIRQVLKSADEILTDQEGKDLVKQALVSANDAATDLKSAAADFRGIAGDLETFVAEKRDPAGETIDSMAEASRRFADVTYELQSISASLDSIVQRVESGEGSLGKLVNDDAAHDEFLAAVKEVRDLVAEIRDNPKSFVKFSLF